MSLEKIRLRKLLQILYSTDRQQIALLREDIRNEIKKATEGSSGGGDFHTGFWADTKAHAARKGDLRNLTKQRIAANKGCARLYPELCDGFLKWWDEKRRWRNEPFVVTPDTIGVHLPIKELGSIVKIENLLSIKIGDQYHRLIYPYFSEEPALPPEGARTGLWLLTTALPSYRSEDIRILDVLRSMSFGIVDYPFSGNERDIFTSKYAAVLARWKKLKEEY